MNTFRGRIKPGTLCVCDFHSFYWPNLPADLMQKNFHADMVFNIEFRKCGTVYATGDNFGGGIWGRSGRYGNGTIYLSKGGK